MNSFFAGRARDVIGVLLLCGAMGSCANRSVVTTEGALSYGPEVKKIRIEMTNGTLDVAVLEEGAGVSEVTWQGGLRRDSLSEEGLEQIEQVPTQKAKGSKAGTRKRSWMLFEGEGCTTSASDTF